jgi:hypothetical protein
VSDVQWSSFRVRCVCENKVAMSLEKTSYCVFWDTYKSHFLQELTQNFQHVTYTADTRHKWALLSIHMRRSVKSKGNSMR